MYPVECVARGYLAGSGLVDYQRTGAVCGVALPGGLRRRRRGCPSRSSPRPPRPPSATTTRTSSYDAVVDDRRRRTSPPSCARLTLAVYARAEADRPRAAASCWPTPSSSSAAAPTARSCWPTRCSPPTRPGSGRPTSGSPAGRSRRTTSSSCATGCSRRRPAGTGVGGEPPAAAARRGRGAHPGALRRGLRAAHRGDLPTPDRLGDPRGLLAAVDMPHAARGGVHATSSTRATDRSGRRRCCR